MPLRSRTVEIDGQQVIPFGSPDGAHAEDLVPPSGNAPDPPAFQTSVQLLHQSGMNLVPRAGFEPTFADSESAVLPVRRSGNGSADGTRTH